MNIFKKIYLKIEMWWLLLTYKDELSNIYQKLSEIPFSNWYGMWSDLEMLKKKPCRVMKSTLERIRYNLYIEEKEAFGFEESEIRLIKKESEAIYERARYIETGNYLHINRAEIIEDKIKSLKGDGKKSKIGDIATLIYKATGKTYNFDKISAMEVLTIIREINTRKTA
jgi:hypothetical protein